MKRTVCAITLGVACFFTMHAAAQAHVVCGDRVFPTTLTMDDPGVSDEISLPTVGLTPTPGSQSNSYGYEWDKTITEDLGVGINGNYISQTNPAQNGWDNISVTLKDQHPCIQRHPHEEMTWSVGIVRLITGTGSKRLVDSGVIDTIGSTAPTLYFGKGLGDVSSDYLRPIAFTAEVSRVLSDVPSLKPNAWSYAASVQYSLPYLQQNVKATHAPQWLMRMTPIVEVAMTSPDSGGTPTGTISPGILYDSNTWQLGAEAVIPANAATRQSQGTGFIIQFHAFLDAYYKKWFGKPLIKRNLWQ